MKWSLVGILILLGSALSPSAIAWTHPVVRPMLFALAPADFPPGSHILSAGIASNQLLLHDNILRFGPHPRRIGRLTGYAMEATQQPVGTAAPLHLSYLVSIFASHRQALRAWELLYSSWFAQNYYTTPPPVRMPLGEKGAQALFSLHASATQTLSELFFERGAILVEVFEEEVEPASQEGPLFVIASKLSALARLHPHGS